MSFKTRLDFEITLKLIYDISSVHTKSKLLVLVPVLTSVVFTGCFLWSAIEDGWGDFTAYFNTYYNGEQAFEAAMKDVKNSLKEHDISLITGQTTTPFAISSTAHQNFDLAVEKASKLLQFYPNSGNTENCLFMIGISYYYEGDNIRSGRKFIEAQSRFPNSKRFCEALMYYGHIEIRNRNYNDGYNDLLRAMGQAEKGENWEIAAQAAADISDYFLTQGDSSSAAVYLDSAAVFSKNDDASIYACKAGVLLESSRNFKEAIREYEAAWSSARDIRLRFYSRYFLARTERHGKQFYTSLEDLEYLRNDDKYFQYFPLIDYEKGEVLYDSGSVSSAFAEFQRIDTGYATSEAATRSAFRLANIYLRKVGDYQNALKYYQKSASHVAVPTITDRARLMSATLQEYFVDSYKLNLADSLYQKALLAASRNDSTTKHSQEDIDTLYEHVAEAQHALGGFFMFRLQIPDSAINHYLAIVSRFPKSRVYPSALYTVGEYYYSSGDTANGRNNLTKLITEHPESGFSISASSLLRITPKVVIDSAQVAYDRAMAFENRNQHDSAMVILKGSVRNAKSVLSPQVLYAIGWIYENKLNLPDSAYTYYKKLATQYPTSGYSANLNLTLSTFEQAKRDSAEARKRVADSIANAHKQVVRDTLKASTTSSPQIQNSSLPDSAKVKVLPPSGTQKLDSLGRENQSAVFDSLELHRKELDKSKEPKK